MHLLPIHFTVLCLFWFIWQRQFFHCSKRKAKHIRNEVYRKWIVKYFQKSVELNSQLYYNGLSQNEEYP